MLSKSSGSDPDSDEGSEGGVSESVAREVKERRGLGSWDLVDEDASGNGFESCRDDGGIVAIFAAYTSASAALSAFCLDKLISLGYCFFYVF